jgi:hypothetical protein
MNNHQLPAETQKLQTKPLCMAVAQSSSPIMSSALIKPWIHIFTSVYITTSSSTTNAIVNLLDDVPDQSPQPGSADSNNLTPKNNQNLLKSNNATDHQGPR